MQPQYKIVPSSNPTTVFLYRMNSNDIKLKVLGNRIKELYAEKTALLDKYGVFGGGDMATFAHQRINHELESFGVSKYD